MTISPVSTIAAPPCPAENLTVHFSAEQIDERVRAMAAQIDSLYQQSPRLVVVVVLRGAFLFAADLVRYLKTPCQIEFIRLSSYGEEQKSSGVVRPVELSLPALSGEDVLVVEDIIDTGLTLRFLLDYLGSLHRTRSLRLAVLLDKKEARQVDVPVDFSGFEIGNEFVVGYGLDFAGYYRNLPFIGVVPSNSVS